MNLLMDWKVWLMMRYPDLSWKHISIILELKNKQWDSNLLMRGREKKDDKEGQYIQIKRGKGGLRFSGTANQPDIHRN